MPVYLVERELPGVTMAQLEAVERATREMSERFRDQGKAVCYLRTVYLPAESRCLSLFEAASARIARELNDAAHLPYTRIMNAFELGP